MLDKIDPGPPELSPEEYDALFKSYCENCTLEERDLIKLKKDFLHYPKGLNGHVIERPVDVDPKYLYLIGFHILDPETGNLSWVAEEIVPLDALELREKAHLRFCALQVQRANKHLDPEVLRWLEEPAKDGSSSLTNESTVEE